MISLNDSNLKYYLLYGCDTSNQMFNYGDLLSNDDSCLRSDTIILIIANTKTHKVKVVSILRDICTDVKGYGKCKLNSLIVYFGPSKATKIIGELFNINISKYLVLKMENFIKIIDAIGGIDINLDNDEIEFINRWAPEAKFLANYQGNIEQISNVGMNHLNGVQALAHVRDRYYGYTWARTKRQRDVIVAITKQIKKINKFTELVSFGLSMLKYVKTNLNINDIITCAKLLKNLDINDVKTFSIPSGNTKSIRDDGMWRFEIDFNLANQFLLKIINDEDVKDFVV